jgi:hypothetical protein
MTKRWTALLPALATAMLLAPHAFARPERPGPCSVSQTARIDPAKEAQCIFNGGTPQCTSERWYCCYPKKVAAGAARRAPMHRGSIRAVHRPGRRGQAAGTCRRTACLHRQGLPGRHAWIQARAASLLPRVRGPQARPSSETAGKVPAGLWHRYRRPTPGNSALPVVKRTRTVASGFRAHHRHRAKPRL